MDYFNGNTNEDFVNIFKEVLFCRTELTQYIYPFEEFEPDDAIDDHVVRCQSILISQIMHSISDAAFKNKATLTKDETDILYHKKMEELTPLLTEHIDNYTQNIKVEYIDLRKESED